MQYSKDYEQHGGQFAVSYSVPPRYRYDASYTEHAYQNATKQISNQLYDALMHTKQPAVVELKEHTYRVPSIYDDNDYDARLTITARITPVESHHIIIPGYYDPPYFIPNQPMPIRTALRHWLVSVYQKAKRNWQAH